MTQADLFNASHELLGDCGDYLLAVELFCSQLFFYPAATESHVQCAIFAVFGFWTVGKEVLRNYLRVISAKRRRRMGDWRNV